MLVPRSGTKKGIRVRLPGLRSALRRLLLAATGLAMATGGCGGGNGGGATSGSDYVLAPEYLHYGASYAAWSARWQQWSLELPLTHHPLFDTTGQYAWTGQVDPVWFIGGIFGTIYEPSDGSAERTVTIPSGIALFFPIIDIEADNAYCLPPGWVPKSLTELRQWAYDTVSAVADVYCELDGDMLIDAPDLAGAARFRAMAHEFSALMPADNIAVGLCGESSVPIEVNPAASDGIWMMLAPMSPGEHTLRFGGTFPTLGPFHLDITYHITVTP
jgi:hypothetical protein